MSSLKEPVNKPLNEIPNHLLLNGLVARQIFGQTSGGVHLPLRS